MSWWWIGIIGLVTAMFGIVRAGRRGSAPPVAAGLLERMIPWAATGGTRAARSGSGWGARWTEDLSLRPARGLPFPAPRRALPGREPEPAFVESSASPSATGS